MAGLNRETPIPTEIKLHQKSRLLEISFDNGDRFELSYEFLRVFSPSAEVRGHGIGEEKLQIGKRDVDIVRTARKGAVQAFAGPPDMQPGAEGQPAAATFVGSVLPMPPMLTTIWQGFAQRLERLVTGFLAGDIAQGIIGIAQFVSTIGAAGQTQ